MFPICNKHCILQRKWGGNVKAFLPACENVSTNHVLKHAAKVKSRFHLSTANFKETRFNQIDSFHSNSCTPQWTF